MGFDDKHGHFLLYFRQFCLKRVLLVVIFSLIYTDIIMARPVYWQHEGGFSFYALSASDTDLTLPVLLSGFSVTDASDKASSDHNISEDKAVKFPDTYFFAYYLLLILLPLILFFLRRYEMNRLKMKNQLEFERIEVESLRKLNASRSQFFANLSHEFRTPLTLISGNIESLLTSENSEIKRERLESARRNAVQLLALVNQLLDLSKLEEGEMQLQFSRFNVISYATSVFNCFLPQAEVRDIKMIFESGRDYIPVEMDRDKMGRMLNNLLSNALKFTSDGGVVRFVISAIDDKIVEVRVEDNGLGIPDNELTAIFNRFYQCGNSHERRVEGTGIGLAHTRELAALHKGSITAYSKKNEYTAFILRLPVITAEPINDTAVADALFSNGLSVSETPCLTFPSGYPEEFAESINGKAREIILIVEDNSEVRNFILQHLEEDYKTLEADDGESGLEIARQIIPDLIISDVMMPGIDGYQFSNEIRNNQLTSHIPLILLTAKSDMDDRLEGFKNGIDDYITKPFSIRELKAIIRNLLNIRKLLRERFERNGFTIPSDALSIPADKAFLEKAIRIIEDHIEDSGYKVESLAGELSISVSQLNRKLNALINLPAGELMRSHKLKRAAEMLKNKSGTVSEICYTLGFNDHAYFARSFRKYYGCSPSEFMKSADSDITNLRRV